MSKTTDFPRKNDWTGVKLFGHGKSSNPKKYSNIPARPADFAIRKCLIFQVISDYFGYL